MYRNTEKSPTLVLVPPVKTSSDTRPIDEAFTSFRVGTAEGCVEGCEEGKVEGSEEGCAVGWREGWRVGCDEG